MNKTLTYYLGLPYTIELSQTPDEGWFVRVKELPGCMSQGDTAEEALAMIQEAMSLWLETALEDGLPIPEPRQAEDYSGKFVVRLPRSLHRDLAEKAGEEGVSLNQLVATTLAQSGGRAPAAATPPSESHSEPLWPGLKAGVRQALLAAGLDVDAGELDERLFAHWFDHLLSQVESSLRDDYARESGLPYLETLQANLHTAGVRSPVIASLHRTIRLLRKQVETQIRLQQGMVSGVAWRQKLEQLVESRNRDVAQKISQEVLSEISPAGNIIAESRPRYFLHRKERKK